MDDDYAFEMATANIRFGPEDIPRLVEETLPRHRVVKLSPRPAAAEDLAGIFQNAMRYG